MEGQSEPAAWQSDAGGQIGNRRPGRPPHLELVWRSDDAAADSGWRASPDSRIAEAVELEILTGSPAGHSSAPVLIFAPRNGMLRQDCLRGAAIEQFIYPHAGRQDLTPHRTQGRYRRSRSGRPRVLVNEGNDPAVARDIEAALDRLVPHSAGYTHAEGNADSHIKTALIGSSETIWIESSTGLLCRWLA